MTVYLKMALAALAGAAVAALAQERRVREAHYDEAFGMLTRQGLDAKLRQLTAEVDVLFIDLDHVHEMNATLGYQAVDKLIRSVFQLRRGDALIVGRWYSGDEIVIVTKTGDGDGLAERLTARMAQLGVSATIAVAGASPRDAIETAAREAQAAKANGNRGQVVSCC